MSAICLYFEPDESSPDFPTHFLKIHLHSILLPTPGSSKWSISFRIHHQNPIYTSPLPRWCYMPHSTHYFRFENPKNIRWSVQIIKHRIMYLSPITSNFAPLMSKDSSQYPIRKQHQPTFLPQCELPRFTFIQNNGKNYSFVLLVSKQEHKRFCAEF